MWVWISFTFVAGVILGFIFGGLLTGNSYQERMDKLIRELNDAKCPYEVEVTSVKDDIFKTNKPVNLKQEEAKQDESGEKWENYHSVEQKW